VLIELQKTNVLFDILRFRRYLGSQYRKEEDVIQPDGSSAKESLPIVTIYFLGFSLSQTLPAVIKVDRQYIDVLSGKSIAERHDFIECLTHDSYVIQIPGLKLEMKNRLEYVLSIFKQEKLLKGDNRLKDYDYEIEDELLQKILKQLAKAAADNDLLEQMEMEELAQHEYETAFAPLERKIEKHEKTIEEKDKYISELLKKLEGKR
jgi:predicted RNase H-like nuclease (RuvC/YqgF family)